MQFELTDSQATEVLEDEWLSLEFSKENEKYRIYLELDRGKEPFYFELVHSKNGKTIKGYAFDTIGDR